MADIARPPKLQRRPDCPHLAHGSVGRVGTCALTGGPAPPSMCEHCRGDRTGLFRAKLEAGRARKDLRCRLAAGGDPGSAKPLRRAEQRAFPCSRYQLEVDAEFCVVCRTNPALKQALSAHRTSALRLRIPCVHRGEQTGETEVKCCGGRTKTVPAYACARHEQAHDYLCRKCPDYEPSEEEPGLPRHQGCVDWGDLWQVHRGKTVLVLACGPSVLLPGEDPAPETVDTRSVECVVVLSTNWAWKWYADICDYTLCYDVTPAQGWRPPGVKLLTVLRPRGTMKVIERCQPYCVFPACDYGDVARGRPLPTSRNSGFAALAMAAYLGAGVIKVIGMDFSPAEASAKAGGKPVKMHFYHETDFDVDRRVKSFQRNKARVQEDLTKLLVQIRAMGIQVQNLSPISTLSWE